MRFAHALCTALLSITSLALPSPAQQASGGSLAPERQFHIDLAPIGITAGVAGRVSPRMAIGVSLGAGGNWFNYMVLSGRHFAESDGLSYQDKDGEDAKTLLDMARATIFVRRYFDSGRHLDIGVKASGFLHSDTSDDDFGGGIFTGVNVTYNWGQWRRVRFASELDVGRYAESGSRPAELGVNVAPVLVRFTFP